MSIRPLLVLLCGLSLCAFAQERSPSLSDALRHPGWSYGVQVFGGRSTTSIPPIPHEPSQHTGMFGAAFHAGRVLTHERGEGWLRGTLEYDVNIIPVDLYWVQGRQYYLGGFEAVAGRWNFTQHRGRLLPFAGVEGGMLFSPQNFPPGDTAHENFTVGVDLGAHVFTSKKQSFDVTTRLHHLSNAGFGRFNPGVPLSLQVVVGYTWY
jgi:hypothetical protein